MNLRLLVFILIVICFTQCSDEPDIVPLEPVVSAYDTLELRYQQMGDLAMELMSNVSVDPGIRLYQVTELLERQPVVSLDFRRPVTTRKDILTFVNYQKKIDGNIRKIFNQLGDDPKWREAPLVGDFRARYDSIKNSIGEATMHFNSVVKEAKLNLVIPTDTTNVTNNNRP